MGTDSKYKVQSFANFLAFPIASHVRRSQRTQLNPNNLSVQNHFLGCPLIAVVEPPEKHPVLLRNVARIVNDVQAAL